MLGTPGFLRLAILAIALLAVGVARTAPPQYVYYNSGDYTRQPKGYQVIYDADGNPVSVFYYDASYESTGNYAPYYDNNPNPPYYNNNPTPPYYDNYYRTYQPTRSAFPDRDRADAMFKSYRDKK